MQVPDEEVQDWRAGGGGPFDQQGGLHARLEQRPAAGAGQVRTRVATPVGLAYTPPRQ